MPASKAPVSLPHVVLKDKRVPFEVLSLIPLPTMERFQVSAFEVNDTHLKLAIVYPEQLKQGFYVAIEDIGRKIGKKVELYRTDAGSMRSLVRLYRQGLAKAAPAADAQKVGKPLQEEKPVQPRVLRSTNDPKPPLFELGKTVAFNYLKRIPLDFAKAHRLVSVDFHLPNVYWFATDGSQDESLTTVLPFIEQNNHIKIYNFVVGKKDLDDLLAYYEEMLSQEKKAPKQEKSVDKEAERRHEKSLEKAFEKSEGEEGEQKMAKGVIVPDVQAAILTAEEEKGGLAGLFQRVTQTLGSAHEKNVVEDASAALPPMPKAPENAQAAPAPAPATPAATQPANAAAPAAAPAQTGTAVVPAAPGSAAAATQPANAAAPVVQVAGTHKEGAKDSATGEDGESTEIGKLLPKQVEELDELKDYIKKGYIPRIVAAVVSYAIHEKASDIHIEVFEDEVRVRYRVDGQLIDIVKLPPDVHGAMVSRIKILSRLRLDETRVPQDGRFDVNFEHAQVDLRVSIMPTVHGEKVVMRILDKGKGVATLESLGLMGLGYQNLVKSIQKPFGICLTTGPTGSGKSTTLYAVLNRIATPNVNVITLEDPVEYEMKGINQSQIRPKIGFTFAEGLRSILRQDPNIIMVGEIRDGETANMATQAALTGHLVLSTLHTNDAAGAIPRLTNMGIEPFLITSSLNVAVGQRLVRKICQKCKAPINLPDGIKAQIAKDLDAIAQLNPLDAERVTKPYVFYQGTGCDACGGKGYQGRLGIYEVLMMTEALEELTLARESGTKIQETAQKEGMLTMYQDGLLKVIAGLTTLDEVLRETSNK